MTYFLPINISNTLQKVTKLYIREIVSLHDPRFNSKLWKRLQKVIEIKLHHNSTFHTYINGQSERII